MEQLGWDCQSSLDSPEDFDGPEKVIAGNGEEPLADEDDPPIREEMILFAMVDFAEGRTPVPMCPSNAAEEVIFVGRFCGALFLPRLFSRSSSPETEIVKCSLIFSSNKLL